MSFAVAAPTLMVRRGPDGERGWAMLAWRTAAVSLFATASAPSHADVRQQAGEFLAAVARDQIARPPYPVEQRRATWRRQSSPC